MAPRTVRRLCSAGVATFAALTVAAATHGGIGSSTVHVTSMKTSTTAFTPDNGTDWQ